MRQLQELGYTLEGNNDINKEHIKQGYIELLITWNVYAQVFPLKREAKLGEFS